MNIGKVADKGRKMGMEVGAKEQALTGRVQETAAKLRKMVLACEPHTQLGSLRELAEALGVGIVTFQQASRLLEHQGLLEVRRGPGGGYFGTRPDAEALGRAISGYLLAHGRNEHEAIEIISLLDCELLAEAAKCTDETLRMQLEQLALTIDSSEKPEERVLFENRFHDILFRMVNKPLMELLGRMTMRLYHESKHFAFYSGPEGSAVWKAQRHRIAYAILQRDAELARFEAMRRRSYLMQQIVSDAT